MSPIPLRFWNLTRDARILRTTDGERERERTLSTQWNYVGMKTVLAERGSGVGWSGSVRSPASSGGGRRAVQGDLPGLAAAAASATELSEGPARGRGGGGRGPVDVIGAVGVLRVRGLRRRAGARQRRGRGRGPGGTSGFVAGGVALGTGPARADLAFLLRVAHLHLLTVGSDSVLERQRAVLSERDGDRYRQVTEDRKQIHMQQRSNTKIKQSQNTARF